MKTSNSSVVVVVMLIVLGLGYALFLTRPSSQAVELKMTEIAGSVKPINTQILESEGAKSLTGLRIFGTRPIDPPAGSTSRRNPFDGI